MKKRILNLSWKIWLRKYVKYSKTYYFQFLFGNLTYQMIIMIKKKLLFLH